MLSWQLINIIAHVHNIIMYFIHWWPNLKCSVYVYSLSVKNASAIRMPEVHDKSYKACHQAAM